MIMTEGRGRPGLCDHLNHHLPFDYCLLPGFAQHSLLPLISYDETTAVTGNERFARWMFD